MQTEELQKKTHKIQDVATSGGRRGVGGRKAFPLTAVDLKPKSHPYSPAKMGLFRISRVGIWGLQTRASVQMARDRGRVYRWEGSWEGNSNKIANKEPLAFPLQLLGREERLLPGCGEWELPLLASCLYFTEVSVHSSFRARISEMFDFIYSSKNLLMCFCN